MTTNVGYVSHYNQQSWGPLHIYISITTGKRVAFRANEIKGTRLGPFGSGVVTTVGGLEFPVSSPRPECIR